MDKGCYYDKASADYAVAFIESLCHTKGTWARKPFELIDWQEQIIRDIFGTLKPFMKPAKNASKSAAIAAMQRKLEEEVDKR